jgi:hypothetical protein
MPDTTSLLTTAAAGGQGPGITLRVILLVVIVGCAVFGWFLLRGYRGDGS